jgi:nucleotide-binding universal stress UspA family protein
MTNSILRRILVPLDGSATAEAILPQLRRLLDRHESELLLFHALPLSPFREDAQAEKYLRRISFQLTNEGFPSRTILRSGLAAEAILETAAAERATLIALSTHGRTGVARWVLGSVAEKVLQGSAIPVLVARSFPSPVSRGKLESSPVRNFLVPLDGSRLSLAGLDPLLNFARPVDAHVTLLHVAEPSPYEGRWEPTDETLKEADQILRSACVPSTLENRKGDPGEEILKAIEANSIDLVAMTTHGRSGLSRWVFGSVTAKVLRSAPVPLLVVRSGNTAVPPEKPALAVAAVPDRDVAQGLLKPQP